MTASGTLPKLNPPSAVGYPPSSGSDKWTVVALFWFVYFLNQADRQVIFSVFPLVQQELELSETQLGWLGSTFFWIYGVLVPLAGSLGDTFNRKKLIVLALVVWSAATFSSGLVAGFALLLLLRSITGFGEAFYYPAATSIITDYHSQRTRATAMSVHQTSVYVGVVMSGTLAGYVGQHYGWRSAFLSFGITGLLFAMVLGKTLREPVRGAADAVASQKATSEVNLTLTLPDRLRETFRSPTAVVLMLAFAGMNFVNAAFLPWMTTLLFRKFEMTLADAGFTATFYHHVGAFAGVLIGGKLADRWASGSRLGVLGRPLIQAVGLLGGAPFIYTMAAADARLTVTAALGFFGLFRGLYDSNLFASLYEVVRPEARATATGIMIAGAFLVGGSASVVIGWLSERIGLGPALAATSIAYVAAGLLLLLDCAVWFRRDAAKMRATAA